MGWTFQHKPVGQSAIAAIKESYGAEWWAEKVVASSATWSAVFLVVKVHEPDSTVYVPNADGFTYQLAVFAIRNTPKARDGFNFGYKDMTETMGPYGCEAPLSILAKCSELKPLIGDPEYSSLKSATEYRARCARKAAAKAAKRSLRSRVVPKIIPPDEQKPEDGEELIRLFIEALAREAARHEFRRQLEGTTDDKERDEQQSKGKPAMNRFGYTPERAASIFDSIRTGDRVTIVNRFGQKATGRATLRGPAGWVLNMGGRYGTPAIADERNIVKVVPRK